jgi:hypothetical protein
MGLDRWRHLAGLLSQVDALGFVDPLPAHLTADLALTQLLATGSAEVPEQPWEIRVAVLDAISPGGCALADVLAEPASGGDAAAPAWRPGIVRRAGWLPPSAALSRVRARLSFSALVPDDPDLAPGIRAQLIDAHAVVIVVSYRDVIADPVGGRAAETARRVGGWLPLVTDVAAPELVTLAVDGAEASNSEPHSRLGSTRRQARKVLELPASWPSAGITEISSRLALDAVTEHRVNAAPASYLGWALDAYGVTGLLERTLVPFDRDPARWLTETALRRARATFTRAGGELADQLVSRPPGGQLDSGQVLRPRYARQREAWLIARGLASSLTSASLALGQALA